MYTVRVLAEYKVCTGYTIQWSAEYKVCTVYTIQWSPEYKSFKYNVHNTIVLRIQGIYVQSIQYNGLQNTRY